MPWKECSVMDERLQFVARRLTGEPMAELCREFAISRKTGYKIFDRYKECGVQGLTDRSRRPYRYAHQLLFQVENYILNVKREHTVGADISGCSKKLISHSIGSSSNSRVVRETSVLTNLNARRRRCQ
jgi:hypothetical protein